MEVVADVVRTETRKEDMRMIEDTKKWVLSPERKAPQSTREYTAKHLDSVLDKFLKTMQTTATRLQEKLLRPEIRQKGKEQVREKARDSVLQLLSRLQGLIRIIFIFHIFGHVRPIHIHRQTSVSL